MNSCKIKEAFKVFLFMISGLGIAMAVLFGLGFLTTLYPVVGVTITVIIGILLLFGMCYIIADDSC